MGNGTDWSALTGLDGRNGEAAAQLLADLRQAQADEVGPLLYELASMIMRENQVCELSARVFPRLAELVFVKDADCTILLLDFLGTLKTMLLVYPVGQLDRETRLEYYDSVWRLIEFCKRLFDPKEMRRLEPEVKTSFSMIYLSLLCWEPDAAAFLLYKPFDGAFHVKCPHCADDVHSLYVGRSGSSPALPIRPAPPVERVKGQVLLEEEVYRWFQSFLTACGEPYYSKLLPYLYGEYTCGECKRDFRVMDGIVGYLKDNFINIPEVGEEEIEKALRFAGGLIEKGEYERAAFYEDLALSWQIRRTGEQSAETARIFLLRSGCCAFLHQYQKQRFYAQKALKILQAVKAPPLELAEAYHRLGTACGADYDHRENNDLALFMEYCGKAREIYDRELGAGNEKSQRIDTSVAVTLAEQMGKPRQGIEMLEDLIMRQRAGQTPDKEKIADLQKTISDIYEAELSEYDGAIRFYLPHLQYVCEEYGPDSDMAADCYEGLAQLYEKSGEPLKAADYFEKALEININELGRVYLLPEVFKKAATGTLRLFNREKDPEDVMERSMSAAASFDNVGNLYLQKADWKKALRAYKKALALRRWVFSEPIKEVGDSHRLLAQAHAVQGDEQAMLRDYVGAMDVYRQVIERDREDGRELFLPEIEECAGVIKDIVESLEKQGYSLEQFHWREYLREE